MPPDRYKVVMDEPGCHECGEGRLWSVADTHDEDCLLGMSWGLEETAQDVCNWMNQAYHAGREDAAS